MWVRFLDRWDYTLRNRRGQPTTVYKKGMEIFLPRHRAWSALASGKAVKIDSPRRRAVDGDTA